MFNKKLTIQKDKSTEKKLTLSECGSIFAKAMGFSIKARGAASVAISVIGFAMAFLPMLISLLIRQFSDEVQVLFGKGGGTNLMPAVRLFIMLSALYITRLLWTSIRSYFERRDMEMVQQRMKERVLRCSCNVKFKYIDNYDDFRQRISFVSSTASDRVANSVSTTFVWMQDLITLISIIVVLSSVDIWIVIIMVAASIPAVVLAYFFSEEEYYSKAGWILEWLMTCSYFFEATRKESLNEVRFFRLHPWLRDKFDVMNEKYITVKNGITRKHVFFNSIADIFRNCVYIFILLIVARQIFDNPAVGIGVFMLVFTMAGQLQEVSANVFGTIATFISNVSYMRDFFYLDELDYEKREKGAELPEKHSIEFKDVSFTYPNADHRALHDLNVFIKEGEKIAIVGENGSGKTTFVNLLCALYEPDAGKITMGGIDIHQNLSQVRLAISAIFQDFAKYETSIRENIVISDNNKRMNDAEFTGLLKQTGVLDIVEAQPDGLDEIVGSFSPTGNNLSGGQWQKIALARCAYRNNTKIVVLDEPTAALDPIAEADLYRNFAELTGDRTTILISHRLGIATLVDRILVFDDGRIVEEGTHADLLSKEGLYAKMWNAQSQWYE